MKKNKTTQNLYPPPKSFLRNQTVFPDFTKLTSTGIKKLMGPLCNKLNIIEMKLISWNTN